MDPRISRTRAQVFQAVTSLLERQEPLTFSRVAARSGVARKTLYAHWGSMAQLVGDLLGSRHEQGPPELSADPYINLRTFLRGIRDGFDEPVTRAAMAHLLGQAPTDPAAAEALRELTSARAAQLSALLGITVTPAQLAQLVGPIFFLRFVAGRSATATMLTDQAKAGVELLGIRSTEGTHLVRE